jgi:hypothetical protein
VPASSYRGVSAATERSREAVAVGSCQEVANHREISTSVLREEEGDFLKDRMATREGEVNRSR